MDPSPISFTLFYCFTITRSVYFTCTLLSFYHSIRSILCSQQIGEIDNFIEVGSKVLGCVVCRFHVDAGEKLHSDKQFYMAPLSGVSRSWQASPSEVWLSPTGLIQPWFHKLRETCCCAPHTFLLGFSTGFLNIAPSHISHICTCINLNHSRCLRWGNGSSKIISTIIFGRFIKLAITTSLCEGPFFYFYVESSSSTFMHRLREHSCHSEYNVHGPRIYY
jgi:hypothetical protein